MSRISNALQQDKLKSKTGSAFDQIQGQFSDIDQTIREGAEKVVESTREHGGATMNAETGKFLPAFETKGIYLGGHPDTTGKLIDTEYIGKESATPRTELTVDDVLKHRSRIRRETGYDPTVALGTWVPEQKDIDRAAVEREKDIRGVNIDASTPFYNRKALNKAFKQRPDEVAATNLWDLEEIPNPYFEKKGIYTPKEQ